MNPNEIFQLKQNLMAMSSSVTGFNFLDESAQLKVADDTLEEMFKFVANKYNEIDLSEIEKSHGDFKKFKYHNVITENVKILEDLYRNSEVKGKESIMGRVDDLKLIMNFMVNHSEDLSYLYGKEIPYIQLMYNTMVASCLYSTSSLINLTIRFITIDGTEDVQVLVETLPDTSRYIHLRNLQLLAAAVKDGTTEKLLMETVKLNKSSLNESIGLTMISMDLLMKAMIIPAIVIGLTKIIPIIREIIYAIYRSRIRMEEALEVQTNLIKTNIESLEDRTSNKKLKKVIARQKFVARTLEGMKNKLAVKMEVAEPMVKKDIERENKALKIEKSSVTVQNDMLI